MHCYGNDAQPNRFSHGQHGRDVRYVHTIINAHHASYASPPLYCPGATRPRQARSHLSWRFRVAIYCRRVDLVCD